MIQELLVLLSAIASGWICGRAFEGLPFKAVGWSLHVGWFRDLALGSAVGAVSLVIAATIAWCGGGLRFSLDLSGPKPISETSQPSLPNFR